MTEPSKVSPNYEKSKLVKVFGPNLLFDHPLADLTTYRTGGPARYFLAVDSVEALSDAVRSVVGLEIPYFVIGGGSNLLISDEGFDGLIIKIEIIGLTREDETRIECGAGEALMALVNFATECSLTGLEFASGIWGTVGGALYGNAGAYGGEMKDVVEEVTLVETDGSVKTVGCDYLRFGYRDSYLKASKEIAASVRLNLRKGDKVEIGRKVDEILALRAGSDPGTACSAGCFFKNIPDPNQPFGKMAAGKLLDEAGAKGMSVGGAAVFEKHANMIVNNGGATSKDIRRLADLMKKKVFDKFGIELEEEVIQLGPF